MTSRVAAAFLRRVADKESICLECKPRNDAMSPTGPEKSNYRRSGQAALKSELPFVSTAAIGSSEPIPEVSNSRCVRSQKKFCCGAADLHAASQL